MENALEKQAEHEIRQALKVPFTATSGYNTSSALSVLSISCRQFWQTQVETGMKPHHHEKHRAVWTEQQIEDIKRYLEVHHGGTKIVWRDGELYIDTGLAVRTIGFSRTWFNEGAQKDTWENRTMSGKYWHQASSLLVYLEHQHRFEAAEELSQGISRWCSSPYVPAVAEQTSSLPQSQPDEWRSSVSGCGGGTLPTRTP